MTKNYISWYKSSHSAPTGECVEVACATDGTTGIQDSKAPDNILELPPSGETSSTHSAHATDTTPTGLEINTLTSMPVRLHAISGRPRRPPG